VLQPKYEILTDDEKQALLTKHNLDEKQVIYVSKHALLQNILGVEGNGLEISENDKSYMLYVETRQLA